MSDGELRRRSAGNLRRLSPVAKGLGFDFICCAYPHEAHLQLGLIPESHRPGRADSRKGQPTVYHGVGGELGQGGVGGLRRWMVRREGEEVFGGRRTPRVRRAQESSRQEQERGFLRVRSYPCNAWHPPSPSPLLAFVNKRARPPFFSLSSPFFSLSSPPFLLPPVPPGVAAWGGATRRSHYLPRLTGQVHYTRAGTIYKYQRPREQAVSELPHVVFDLGRFAVQQ